MSPERAEAARTTEPLQHVVDALASREDLTAATVLVVEGGRAEPRAAAGDLTARGPAGLGTDLASLDRLLTTSPDDTSADDTDRAGRAEVGSLVIPLHHPDGALRAALVLDRKSGSEPTAQALTAATHQALSAVRTALDRDSLAEEVSVAAAARQVVRAASNELSTASLLARSRRALLEGFGASGLWWRLFSPVDGGPDEAVFLDAANGRPAIGTPPELAVLADASARWAWAAREVLVLREGLPLPASLAVDAATRGLVETFLRRPDIGALLLTPLGAGEECIGLAVLHRIDGPDWTPAEAHEARFVGHDLGRAVLNARMHERETALVQRLMALDAYKNQLISTISHELRTPLTSVVGNLELLQDLVCDEELDHGLVTACTDATSRGAQRLVTLVDDLLLLSLVTDPEHVHVEQVVDLHDVLDEVVALTAAAARAQDIEVLVEECPRPARVLGDAGQLDKVLVNLVGNAIKYSPSSGVVRLCTEVVGAEVVLSCSDDGLGIARGDQENLFREFFRSEDPAVRARSGTGLGLAIAHRVVAQHGGRIELESELGAGSTFRVVLPVAETEDT